MRGLLLISVTTLSLASSAQDTCAVSITSNSPTCINGTNGTLTVVGTGGPYIYAWAHAPALTIATAGGLAAGDYQVTVIDTVAQCLSMLVGVVEDPPNILLGSMTTTDITCPGAADGTVTFTVNPGPYTWQWMDAPTVTATTRVGLGQNGYTVQVNGGPCPSFVTAFLGDPFMDVAGVANYCPSEPPQLTAYPQWGFQPDVYLWSTGETTTSINIPPGTEGLIEITGIDTSLGCSIQGDITLTQRAAPDVAFTVADSVCLRLGTIAITTSTTADSLVWRWGSNGFSNETDPTITFTEPYWQPISLQGFEFFGCGNDPVRDSIFVRPRLPADFTVEQVPCTPMVDLVFASTSDSCAFFIGDSLVMDLCSGYVRFDMRRYMEYDYTFYSTQPNRCDDTLAVRLEVRTEPTLFLPTAFTPDGDGINDTWPGPVDIPDAGFEIQLFDRWGTNLWSSTDTQAKWDGAALPIGVYTYTMRMRDPCEMTREVAKQGSVTLVR